MGLSAAVSWPVLVITVEAEALLMMGAHFSLGELNNWFSGGKVGCCGRWPLWSGCGKGGWWVRRMEVEGCRMRHERIRSAQLFNAPIYARKSELV